MSSYGSATGRRSAGIRPANPAPTATRTPWRTSSSSPCEVRAAVVEQKNGCGVGRDDRHQLPQHLVQEVVDVARMASGRIGDPSIGASVGPIDVTGGER